MHVLMVTSKVREEYAAGAQAAVDKLISALEREQPEGVRYGVTRLSDGVTIVAFLEMEPGQEHPLGAFPSTWNSWKKSSRGVRSRPPRTS
jgi:hypothetical protein